MKNKKIRRSVLLGLIMGLTVCSGVMAENSVTTQIEESIHDETYNDTYMQTITIHSQSGEAAIRLEKDKGEDEERNLVSIKTSEKSGGDIILQAAGSGIHTTKTGNSVILNADGSNQIYFNTTGKDQSGNYQPSGKDGNGITAKGEMDINLTAHGDNIIRGNNGDGINTESTAYGKIHLEAKNNIITVSDYGIYSRESSSGTDPTQEYIAESGNNQISGGEDGIHVAGNGILFLKAENGQNIIRGGYTATAAFSSDSDKNGSGIYLEKNSGGKVSLEAKANIVEGTEDGIYAESGTVDLTASSGENAVSGGDAGIKNKGGAISLTGQNNLVSGGNGIYAESGTVDLTASSGENAVSGDDVGIKNKGGAISLTGQNNLVSGESGIYAESGTVTLTASSGENAVSGDDVGIENKGGAISLTGQDNLISGKDGILAEAGTVTLTAEKINYISGGVSAAKLSGDGVSPLSDSYAVLASGENTKVDASAEQNLFLGAVYADEKASVQIGQMDKDGETWSSSTFNYVASSKETDGIVSALYAGDGAEITLIGESNTILSSARSAEKSGSDTAERTIWATEGGTIGINGQTAVIASLADSEESAEGNHIGIAIAAGMDKITDGDTDYDMVDSLRSHVNIVYSGNSSIVGDIAAGYGGTVNISANPINLLTDSGESNPPSLTLTGNALAANGGILNIDLGNGGTFTGRADDYGDAGANIEGDLHGSGESGSFYNPVFSNTIESGGVVNLTMGAGSRWNVTGQSWITRIDTTKAGSVEDSGRAVIDLVQANTDKDHFAHALTIYEMNGDAVFNMSLDGDRTLSDMLYMKKADGNYIINVVDAVTTADMYADDFSGLRFATVGAGSDVSFRAVTIGGGVLNVEYEVGTDLYDGNEENNAYNSTAEDNTSGNTEKPGDTVVDNFFGSTDTPVDEDKKSDSSESEIKVFSSADEEQNDQTGTQTGAVNYKLIGRKDEQVSDAGQSVINMSRVNYSNAVYMDRLNKRMGEARYLEGDDGLWVRLRHDRIGKDNAFRSMNTMMELGYDRKVQSQKDGEHRRGVAFDYMRGTADYTNVMGDGDVRRAGVWLYDTWLGDKGHYSDYVVKYGRLSNEFNIFNELGTEVSGDYDNDVWSVSAEYGRKKDIGNDWYFEPQAQMQYAYVTSADYTTSQGTKVELDGIDSLIGRAGFRLGRDTSEGNTVYFKADILHEFLGDQSIRAVDKTGVLSTTYENEGTWYDVGFGFSHRMGKDSYMFLDLEHSFGNDNDETYQINIGLSKAF